MRPVFFLREAMRSVRRNAAPSFAATCTVLVTVLVLGLFIPIVQATTGAADDVRSRVIADVYLTPKADKADIARVRARLENRTPGVGSVQFVSKQRAYAQQKKSNPDAYELLGSNPLPDTFRITPKRPEDITKVVAALRPESPSGGRTVVDPAIDDVRNREEDTKKILSVTSVVKLTMAALAILLIGASILLIANTIRLSLFSRRRELEVMRLVGATDSFIRVPFMLEGVILGALGGGIAIGLLGLGKVALLDPLSEQFALISDPQTMGFAALVALLVGASVLVSAVGSGLSLRRYLRI